MKCPYMLGGAEGSGGYKNVHMFTVMDSLRVQFPQNLTFRQDLKL